jgi:hypothetical protein
MSPYETKSYNANKPLAKSYNANRVNTNNTAVKEGHNPNKAPAKPKK